MKLGTNEGEQCNDNGCGGILKLPRVEGCACHIKPPCTACTSNRITCDDCGREIEPTPPTFKYRALAPGLSEGYTCNPSTDLGGGKRIYDYDYDSSSGSTMVFRGRYAGPVTAEDIVEALGDGTFGHRGPVLNGGHFTYTKITD